MLQELVDVLAIPYKVTIALQKPDYTLSDFYGNCILMSIKLNNLLDNEDNYTDIAHKLKIALEKRKGQLLDNPAMICAVILDPRFSSEINENEKQRLTRLTLSNLWKRYKENIATRLDGNDSNDNNAVTERERDGQDDASLLNSYFAQKGLTASVLEPETQKDSTSDVDIELALDKFLMEMTGGFLRCDQSVMQFWQSKREVYPELYELSMIINGIPPTQTTVERLFSLFSLLYSVYRTQLSPDLLSDMILIITNEDLFRQINEQDIERVKAVSI